MKKICLLMSFMTLMTAFMACEKDDNYSYPPTWKGFSLSPSSPSAGDSITVTAQQDQKGHLINATKYIWTLSCTLQKAGGDVEEYKLTETDKTNYDGLCSDDPSHKFLVPADATGRVTISFEAVYNYSGTGIQVSQGGDYSRPQGMLGSIVSQSGTLSGGATGSMSFIIR